MPQRFRLDPPRALVYLGLGLGACRGGAPALVPDRLASVTAEQVGGWVAQTAPRQGVLHRFTWLYQDEQASKGGRGSARIAVPDSLRIDFAGSLGIGKGSAMVVADSALWVIPVRSVDELVPGISLLWSVLGIARGPGDGDRLGGLEQTGRTAWQYANGSDTVNYLRVEGDPITLFAEVRRAGRIIGRSQMTARTDGTPMKATLTAPTVPSKLEITFYASIPTPAFPPETWARPAEP
jgi:hypothetical protein